MNQDLEALIQASLALREADEAQMPRHKAEFDFLVEEALKRFPGVSRERFLQALRRRADAFIKAQSRPPSLPPRA